MNFLQKKLRFGPDAFTILRYSTSNPPQFDVPKTTEEFLERIQKISPIFNDDGTFNGKASIAEEYALCLIADGKKEKALELYDAITRKNQVLLFLHEPLDCGAYRSEEISPVKDKLGFESIWQYAKLLIAVGRSKEALPLLLEIVEKVETKCYPIHLQDVRVESIRLLMELGVSHVCQKPIEEELKDAKKHQY